MPDIITHSNSNLSRQALQQQAKRRRLTRLFRGAYVNTQEYAALTFAEQYRVRAEAFLATHAKLRAWGITAAALDGAPVLSGAPLHFGGARSHAKSKQAGCSFHEALLKVPSNPVAQTLFECAATSPLPDAILAANHLLRRSTEKAKGSLIASRDLDEKTTEALVWQPVNPQNYKARIRAALDVGTLRGDEPNFLATYSAARRAGFISPEAELAWLGFAQLCALYKGKRGVRKALKAGLYFTDQAESPAESLLIARCAELGFEIPYLQVNILDPENGRFLGRVDGLWPSDAVLKNLYESDSRFGRFFQCRQLGDNESVIVEFDGRIKYQQNYSQVLERERKRQNAIGNLGFRFVRIDWSDLMKPERLRRILEAAHVPRCRQV